MDKIVNSIEHLELPEKIKEHMDYTYASYIEFLDKLFKLDEKLQTNYLKTLKNRELVDNQQAELEESLLIQLYMNFQRKSAIDAIKEGFSDGIITKDEIIKLHKIVIKNTKDDIPENYNFRNNNDYWVGSFGTNGNKVIDYYPPNYEEIEGLLDYILEFLNNDNSQKETNHIFIKPFIAHAFLAYLQAFGNGNTRLARVLQHGKIWQMTNTKEDYNLILPAIYLSKNYVNTKFQYRNLLKDVVNEENWHSWLNYNLNMVDEQIYFQEHNLELIREKQIR